MLLTELDLPAPEAARRLLGCDLIRIVDDQEIIVRIVETEAYDDEDEASHSFRGQTPRTAVMYGPAGIAYVYFTYGMHYCFNIVTGVPGKGSAVLIRAIEPLSGESVIERNRFPKTGYQMTNGPAKLCKALAIDKNLNHHDMEQPPFQLQLNPALSDEQIVVSTRIGISKAVDSPWRFYVKDNPYVSKL